MQPSELKISWKFHWSVSSRISSRVFCSAFGMGALGFSQGLFSLFRLWSFGSSGNFLGHSLRDSFTPRHCWLLLFVLPEHRDTLLENWQLTSVQFPGIQHDLLGFKIVDKGFHPKLLELKINLPFLVIEIKKWCPEECCRHLDKPYAPESGEDYGEVWWWLDLLCHGHPLSFPQIWQFWKHFRFPCSLNALHLIRATKRLLLDSDEKPTLELSSWHSGVALTYLCHASRDTTRHTLVQAFLNWAASSSTWLAYSR